MVGPELAIASWLYDGTASPVSYFNGFLEQWISFPN